MEQAWDVTAGSESVIVAVVDTGIAYEDYGSYMLAPDLAQTAFEPGYDFVNNDAHANDDHSHGTHVAGTIAQSTNNATGAAGIAYNTTVMPVKVLDGSGSGSLADVADGIYYAVNNGAKVINMSLGASQGTVTLQQAVQYAYDQGVTIVAAAGNDGTGNVGYPAKYDEVIAVGATRYDNQLAPYSNYGDDIDIVAPGGDMNTDLNGDGFGENSNRPGCSRMGFHLRLGPVERRSRTGRNA